MFKKSFIIISLCFFAVTAQAKGTLVSAAAPEGLANIIRDMGYSASITTDGAGDPMIESSFDGYNFEVIFFGCSGGNNCKTLLFRADFRDTADRISAESVMEYNREYRWGRAYQDHASSTVLEMDLNLTGGTPRANFETSFGFWINAIGNFSYYLPY